MKKIILTGFVLIGLTSCLKDYTCTCNLSATINGINTPSSPPTSKTIKAMSSSNAKKLCNKGDNTISGVSTDCEIQ